MNTISIHDLKPDAKINSFENTAGFFKFFYPELVEELLESFTDFTDADIIQEIVDLKELPYTCVIEKTKKGLVIHGYIKEGSGPA